MVWAVEERFNKGSNNNNNNDQNVDFTEIDKKEKEIVRLIRIAEKDRKDSMVYTQRIRRLNEQLQSLLGSGVLDEKLLKCGIDLDICSTSLPASSPPLKNVLRDYENQQPNISKISTSAPTGEFMLPIEGLKDKEDELRRVKLRATEEASRAASLKVKEEELQKLLAQETDRWKRTVSDLRGEIDRKEKEIVRLSILAEQDKKAGMVWRDQISKLKKSLEAFISVRADVKSEQLQRIIASCGTEDVSSSSPYMQSSYLLSPQRPPSPPFPLGQHPLRSEADSLYRENSRKDCELARLRAIAENESKRAISLKNKVEELKAALVEELEKADRALAVKLREIRSKQEAIHKVSARAERERSKSLLLQEEINRITAVLSGDKKEVKKSEYAPDMAYLSEFNELVGLETTPTKPGVAPEVFNDPIQFMHSPPCKQIQLSLSGAESSECVIFTQKMKDLEQLEKERTKKDEELARLKRLAEAERYRYLLLKEKMQELKGELKSMRTREMSHTL